MSSRSHHRFLAAAFEGRVVDRLVALTCCLLKYLQSIILLFITRTKLPFSLLHCSPMSKSWLFHLFEDIFFNNGAWSHFKLSCQESLQTYLTFIIFTPCVSLPISSPAQPYQDLAFTNSLLSKHLMMLISSSSHVQCCSHTWPLAAFNKYTHLAWGWTWWLRPCS